MKFLITGITGFVGPHLANLLLEKGHEVFGLIRGSNGRQADLVDVIDPSYLNKIKWMYGDLTNYRTLISIFKEIQFDGVFHLAAQSHPPTSFKQPVKTFSDNVMGSVNLISCIEDYQEKCRMHFCSTSEVYGDACKEAGPLKESSPLAPKNPYGASKAAIDLYVQERIFNFKINGFITRAFSHTGPRRGYNFSISSDAYQIAKMVLGLQDRTLLIGNLNTERVVIDVRDCVMAYYLLMMSEGQGVFNVAGSNVHKMEYFTDLLIEYSGLKGITKRIHKPFYRPIDIQIQMADTFKLKEAIGWTSIIPIEETIKDLLDYWVRKLKQ